MSFNNEIAKAVDLAFEQAENIEGSVIDIEYYVDSGTYDPITDTTTGSASSVTIKALTDSASLRQISDGIAQVGDLFLTVKGKLFDSVPSANDHVMIEGVRYAIIFVNNSMAGITYELQIRR